jgi:hypothetical protein
MGGNGVSDALKTLGEVGGSGTWLGRGGGLGSEVRGVGEVRSA